MAKKVVTVIDTIVPTTGSDITFQCSTNDFITGELMIAYIVKDDNVATTDSSGDWTKLIGFAGDGQIWIDVWYKEAVAADEAGPDYVFSGDSEVYAGYLLRVNNCGTTPASLTTAIGTSEAPATSAQTASAAASFIFAGFGNDSNSGSQALDTTITSGTDAGSRTFWSSGNGDCGGAIGWYLPGSTSVPAFTHSFVDSEEWGAWVFEVKDPTTAATVEVNNWAFYQDGTESGSTIIGSINTNPSGGSIPEDTTFQVRFDLRESGNTTRLFRPQARLQYKLNAGSWTDVTSTSNVIRATGGSVANGTSTTRRLGTSYTYNTTNYATDLAHGVCPYFDSHRSYSLLNSGHEILFQIQLRSADTTDGDTVSLRILIGEETADVEPTAWPVITVGTAGPKTATVSADTPTTEASADAKVVHIASVAAEIAAVEASAATVHHIHAAIDADVAAVEAAAQAEKMAKIAAVAADVASVEASAASVLRHIAAADAEIAAVEATASVTVPLRAAINAIVEGVTASSSSKVVHKAAIDAHLETHTQINTDPECDSPTGWTLNNVSVSGGKVVFPGDDVGDQWCSFPGATTLKAGDRFHWSISLEDWVSGGLLLYVANTYCIIISNHNGTASGYATATDDGSVANTTIYANNGTAEFNVGYVRIDKVEGVTASASSRKKHTAAIDAHLETRTQIATDPEIDSATGWVLENTTVSGGELHFPGGGVGSQQGTPAGYANVKAGKRYYVHVEKSSHTSGNYLVSVGNATAGLMGAGVFTLDTYVTAIEDGTSVNTGIYAAVNTDVADFTTFIIEEVEGVTASASATVHKHSSVAADVPATEASAAAKVVHVASIAADVAPVEASAASKSVRKASVAADAPSITASAAAKAVHVATVAAEVHGFIETNDDPDIDSPGSWTVNYGTATVDAAGIHADGSFSAVEWPGNNKIVSGVTYRVTLQVDNFVGDFNIVVIVGNASTPDIDADGTYSFDLTATTSGSAQSFVVLQGGVTADIPYLNVEQVTGVTASASAKKKHTASVAADVPATTASAVSKAVHKASVNAITGYYVYQSVNDPDIDNGAQWFQTNTVIENGYCHFPALGLGNSVAYDTNSINPTPGRTYIIELEVFDYVAGELFAKVGAAATPPINANGKYSYEVTAVNGALPRLNDPNGTLEAKISYFRVYSSFFIEASANAKKNSIASVAADIPAVESSASGKSVHKLRDGWSSNIHGDENVDDQLYYTIGGDFSWNSSPSQIEYRNPASDPAGVTYVGLDKNDTDSEEDHWYRFEITINILANSGTNVIELWVGYNGDYQEFYPTGTGVVTLSTIRKASGWSAVENNFWIGAGKGNAANAFNFDITKIVVNEVGLAVPAIEASAVAKKGKVASVNANVPAVEASASATWSAGFNTYQAAVAADVPATVAAAVSRFVRTATVAADTPTVEASAAAKSVHTAAVDAKVSTLVEINTDPECNDAGEWSLGSDTTISGGAIHFNGSAGEHTAFITNYDQIVAGKLYYYECEITNFVAGPNIIIAIGNTYDFPTASNGIKSGYLTATVSGTANNTGIGGTLNTADFDVEYLYIQEVRGVTASASTKTTHTASIAADVTPVEASATAKSVHKASVSAITGSPDQINTDPGFDNTLNWSQTNCSVTNSYLYFEALDLGNAVAIGEIEIPAIVVGRIYIAEVELFDYVSGSFTVRVGGATSSAMTANGKYRFELFATTTGNPRINDATGLAEGKFSYFRVYEAHHVEASATAKSIHTASVDATIAPVICSNESRFSAYATVAAIAPAAESSAAAKVTHKASVAADVPATTVSVTAKVTHIAAVAADVPAVISTAHLSRGTKLAQVDANVAPVEASAAAKAVHKAVVDASVTGLLPEHINDLTIHPDNWTVYVGSGTPNGDGTCTFTGAGGRCYEDNNFVESGKVYEVKFTVTGITDTYGGGWFQGLGPRLGQNILDNGTYIQRITTGTVGPLAFGFYGPAVVSNVSIKKVSGVQASASAKKKHTASVAAEVPAITASAVAKSVHKASVNAVLETRTQNNTDPEIDSAVGWTLVGTGLSISGGQLHFNNTSAGARASWPGTTDIKANKRYHYHFKISNYDDLYGGSVVISIGGANLGLFNSDGVYSGYVTANADGTTTNSRIIDPGSGAILDFDYLYIDLVEGATASASAKKKHTASVAADVPAVTASATAKSVHKTSIAADVANYVQINTDPNCDSSAGWYLPDDVTVSGGKLVFPGTDAPGLARAGWPGLEQVRGGVLYYYELQIVNYSAGSIYMTIGDQDTPSFDANGTYSGYVTAIFDGDIGSCRVIDLDGDAVLDVEYLIIEKVSGVRASASARKKRTASVAADVPAVTASAASKSVHKAAIAADVPAATASAAATWEAGHGTYQAAVAADVPAVTASATAKVTHTAAIAADVPAVTATAHLARGTKLAQVDANVPATTASVSTRHIIKAAVAAETAAVIASNESRFAGYATVVAVTPAVTATATAKAIHKATVAADVPIVEASATAKVTHKAAIAADVPAVTAVAHLARGTKLAQVDAATGPAEASAAAKIVHKAAVDADVGPPEASATSKAVHVAAVAADVGAVTASAVASKVAPTATIDASTGPVEAAASAKAIHITTVAAEVPSITASAAVRVTHIAAIDAVVTIEASAHAHPIAKIASIAAATGPVTASAGARKLHTAAVDATIGPTSASLTALFFAYRCAIDAVTGPATASASALLKRRASVDAVVKAVEASLGVYVSGTYIPGAGTTCTTWTLSERGTTWCTGARPTTWTVQSRGTTWKARCT